MVGGWGRFGSMRMGGLWGGVGSWLDNIFSFRRWHCLHLDGGVVQLLSSLPAFVVGLSSPPTRIKDT